MTQNDFQKFQELIKEELRPIKDQVELIKKKVDHQELFLDITTQNVRIIKEQQSLMNEKLDEHTKALNTHTIILDSHIKILDKHTKKLDEHTKILENQILPSVVTTETEIKAYSDMYKVNNSNGKKLEKRLEVLEDQAGIIPPPELVLITAQ